MLCSLVLDATVKSLNDVAWTVGDQFDVVSVSIDPKDTPESATKKRAQVVDSYARAAAIYLLSPEGHIARYLYGIQYEPGDVRLGLLEASEGRSITTTERILMYCYHYDPQGKKYSLVAMNVMRLGG